MLATFADTRVGVAYAAPTRSAAGGGAEVEDVGISSSSGHASPSSWRRRVRWPRWTGYTASLRSSSGVSSVEAGVQCGCPRQPAACRGVRGASRAGVKPPTLWSKVSIPHEPAVAAATPERRIGGRAARVGVAAGAHGARLFALAAKPRTFLFLGGFVFVPSLVPSPVPRASNFYF